MKSTSNNRFITRSLSCVLLGGLLTSAAHAQMWLESISADSVTFVVRAQLLAAEVPYAGLYDPTIDGYHVDNNVNDTRAGVRVTFDFSLRSQRKLNVTLENLSAVHGSSSTNADTVARSVDPLGAATARNVTFGEGRLTEFGFSVNPSNNGLAPTSSSLALTSMTSIAPSSGSVDSQLAFQAFNPLTVHIPAYTTDVGARSVDNDPNGDNRVANGLDAGKTAKFQFLFANTNWDSSKWNPDAFFYGNGSPKMDFIAVFSGTKKTQYNGDDVTWDKVGVNADFFSYGRPTPEPSTYGLIGAAGLMGLVYFRKRAKKAV